MSIESLTLYARSAVGRSGAENQKQKSGSVFQSITLTVPPNGQNKETLHGGVFYVVSSMQSPYFAWRSLLEANICAVSVTITSVLFRVKFSISQSDFGLTQQHNHS